MSRPRSEVVEELHALGILVDRREVFLGGEPSDEDETSNKTAMKFIKNMRLLQKFQGNNGGGPQPIVIHQLNDGGNWDAGMAIYDAISSSESHVTMVCHGAAMSMGSIIPQAADLRIIMPNASFMIHYGDMNLNATYRQSKAYIDFHSKCAEIMIDIFSDKCQQGARYQGKNLSFIKKDLRTKLDRKEDWFITAREAVEYGFMDAVLGDKDYETLNQILNVS